MSADKRKKLREALLSLLQIEDMMVQGAVVSVDKDKFTCTVKWNDKEVTDVQLKALKEQEKGAVIIPKAGSTVWMINIVGGWLVLSVEEIDSIYQDAETEIVFNGGENGGIPKVKVIEKNLNELKKYVAKMNSSIPTAIGAVGAGTAANGGTGATSYTQAMASENIQFEDMENKKIKH